MNFIPIGVPTQQNAKQFTYQSTAAGLPWHGLWEIIQSPDQPGAVRFVPDLSVHLVFDLTGQVALDPADKVAKKLTCGPEFVRAQREREGIQP